MFDVNNTIENDFNLLYLIYKQILILLIFPQFSIYVSVNWISIGTCNGLSPVRHQDITWTIADLLSITPLEMNFSEF